MSQEDEIVMVDLLENAVIWRVPQISIVFTFSIRNEAKKFASAVVSLVGTVVKQESSSDDE